MLDSESFIKELHKLAYPQPLIIECKPVTIDRIIDEIDGLKDENVKRKFYGDIFEWLNSVLSTSALLSILGVNDKEILRLATFGKIKDNKIKKNALSFMIKEAPGQLYRIAQRYLPEEIIEHLDALITKKKPKEVLICEKLKLSGIRSIAYIEDTLEFGVIVRFIVNPSYFTRQLVEKPSLPAEIITIAKVSEWFETDDRRIILLLPSSDKKCVVFELYPMTNVAMIRKVAEKILRRVVSVKIEEVRHLYDLLLEIT